MRIIACGDIHMNPGKLSEIPGIEDADLVLLNGDLTNYGGCDSAGEVLNTILAINNNVLAQLGNLDKPEINEYLEKLNVNLHGQARLFQGKICMAGVGGSNPTPFNTPTEFSEKQLYSLADTAFKQAHDFTYFAEPVTRNSIPLIFITHTPPLNTRVDRLSDGAQVGSSAIRKIIEEHQPDLVITGHIHEAIGEDSIGNTPIINPGMLSKGGFVEITLNSKHQLNATLRKI